MTSDPLGRSCEVHEYPSQTNQPLMEHLIALLHQTISALPDSPYGVLGISVGIYGVVCDDTVLFTPYYDLKYSNIRNLLEEEFHVPVIVENEANLSVIGESAFGQNYRNMIFLNIHEGVGMGILVNGQLYKGQNGYAGEFGHTILFPDGRPAPAATRDVWSNTSPNRLSLKNSPTVTANPRQPLTNFSGPAARKTPQHRKPCMILSTTPRSA